MSLRPEKVLLVTVFAACVIAAGAATCCALATPRADADAAWREALRRFGSAPGLPIDVRLPGATADELREAHALDEVVRRVPAPLLRVLARYGGRIVVYDGALTEQPELRSLRGVPCESDAADESTYDDVEYFYLTAARTAFVQFRADPETRTLGLLHELGHMLDAACDDLSQQRPFDAVLGADDAFDEFVSDVASDDRETHRSEYFAECFAWTYASPSTAHEARACWPAAWRFVTQFAMETAERDLLAIEHRVAAERDLVPLARAGD